MVQSWIMVTIPIPWTNPLLQSSEGSQLCIELDDTIAMGKWTARRPKDAHVFFKLHKFTKQADRCVHNVMQRQLQRPGIWCKEMVKRTTMSY